MNGYICFYRGKRIEVYDSTSHGAQLQAAKIFKARRSYEISVVLAEIDGATVTHQPQDVTP